MTDDQVKIKIEDVKTGVCVTGHFPKDVFEWQWINGNYTCDCNRVLYFPNAEELEEEQKEALNIPDGICFGCHRFVVIEIDDNANHPLLDEVNEGYIKE